MQFDCVGGRRGVSLATRKTSRLGFLLFLHLYAVVPFSRLSSSELRLSAFPSRLVIAFDWSSYRVSPTRFSFPTQLCSLLPRLGASAASRVHSTLRLLPVPDPTLETDSKQRRTGFPPPLPPRHPKTPLHNLLQFPPRTPSQHKLP